MTFEELERAYEALGPDPKTKAVDGLNKRLIREKADVSFLRPYVNTHQQYFRTYFQVSLAYLPSAQEKLGFIEDNFDLLHDWWHTDCLIPCLGNKLSFDCAFQKAKGYVESPLPYVRRWGYVLFIPRLIRDPAKIEPLFSLLKNDTEYHVVMAQAWLISCLAMCDPDRTWRYLKDCGLDYSITGRAIQKICDSYVVCQADKARFKALRPMLRSGRSGR